MLGLRRFAPVVPGSLVAVALGIVAVELFDLDDHGVAIVGHIDGGLPSLGLPDAPASRLPRARRRARSACCWSASPRGSAPPRPTPPATTTRSTPTASCSGLGAANLGAGLSSGMVVNGSLSKTAVNGGAGAQSQISGLVVAALTIVTLLFLTGLFENLPEATLAAVVIAAVIELVDIPALRRLYRVWTSRLGAISAAAARPDFLAAIAALLGVLVFDTLPGPVHRHRDARCCCCSTAPRGRTSPCSGGTPARPAGSTSRATPTTRRVPGIVVAARRGGPVLRQRRPRPRRDPRARDGEQASSAVVLDAETVPFIDVTAAEMLVELRERARPRRRRAARWPATSARCATCCAARAPRTRLPCSRRSRRRSAEPAIPSPISFAPMTRQSTAMIALLLAPIHAFISSSRCVARSPSAK